MNQPYPNPPLGAWRRPQTPERRVTPLAGVPVLICSLYSTDLVSDGNRYLASNWACLRSNSPMVKLGWGLPSKTVPTSNFCNCTLAK